MPISTGYDGFTFPSNNNGTCWLPGARNYSSMPQQQYFSQEILPTSNNWPPNTIPNTWSQNENIFMDHGAIQTNPDPSKTSTNLLEGQNFGSKPQSNLLEAQNFVSKPPSSLLEAQNFVNNFANVSNLEMEDIVINSNNNNDHQQDRGVPQIFSQRSYGQVPDQVPQGVGGTRQDWAAQYTNLQLELSGSCPSVRTSSLATDQVESSPHASPRNDAQSSSPSALSSSQYPWLVNRWACF